MDKREALAALTKPDLETEQSELDAARSAAAYQAQQNARAKAKPEDAANMPMLDKANRALFERPEVAKQQGLHPVWLDIAEILGLRPDSDK